MTRPRLFRSALLSTVLGTSVMAASIGAPAPVPVGPEAASQGSRVRASVTDDGVRIVPASGPPSWELRISLLRYGGPADFRPAEDAFVQAGRDRFELLRGSLIEWYENGSEGIEHGFEVGEGAGVSLLRFDFTLQGRLAPKVSEDGRTVLFRDGSGTAVFACVDLAGADADGREVAARWDWVEHEEGPGPVLRLIVDAADHRFPLRLSHRLAALKGAPQPAAIAPAGMETAITSAPANDLCAGAEVIPAGGPFPHLSSKVDLTEATVSGDPPLPSCQTDLSHSVWFAFTPGTSASYSFSVCADAPTATTVEDTVLAVYAATGLCAGLSEIAGGCSDDACGPAGLQSAISRIDLAAGTTYYIVAWTYGTSAPPPGAGELQLQVVRHAPPGPAPPNDQCAGAEVIPGAGPFPWLSSMTNDIGAATSAGDPPAPSCQPNVSRSVWYSFTPAASGRYAFSLCADGPTGSTVDDTVMAIYSAGASCSGFLEIAGGCDDDSCVSEAAQSSIGGVGLAAGTTYYAVVWMYASAPPGAGNTAIQMRVSRVDTPVNDVCSGAAILPPDRPVAGTTVAASDDTRLPAASTCFAGTGQAASTASGGDVAYRFTAPEAGRYSFRVGGYDPSKNAVLYVASDCPMGAPPATVTGCLWAANRNVTSQEEVACLPLASGQTVFVYVDEDAATSGSAFRIEASRCVLESEPNGSPGSANDAACGIEGSIAPQADVDFFALGAPAPGSRVFAMVDGAAGNSTDFDLRVTTAADTLEYDDYNNDIPFGSAAPNVAGARLTGAESYLRVSHYSSAALAEPYRLYAAVQPPASAATPEVEPNNTSGSATAAASHYFSAALSGTTDVDFFSFAAVAGEVIQIGFDLDPARDNTPFNGSLALLDASGATLLLVNDPSSGSSSISGSGSLTAPGPYAPGEALVYRAPAAGTYYAKVAWSSGTPGDYLLSISHDCQVGPPVDPDLDGDGVPDAADCAPADPATWAVPGEAESLVFPSASDPTFMQWSSPPSPGGTVVLYDVLRSPAGSDFQTATCLATGTAATSITDAAVPAAALYYLVRSRNSCGGNLGTRSDGTPRVGAPCP